MEFYRLALGILSVWRITHLLNAEDGPWDIMVRLRRTVGGGHVGTMLDCFACCSLWVAVPLALLLGDGWRQGLLLWLSFSAGAVLLERATSGAQSPSPAPYIEDKE